MAQMTMQKPPSGLEDGIEKMSATQELGLEHAVLDRIMLAMHHSMKMAGKGSKSSLEPCVRGCEIIKQVVDKHHMVMEEEEIYPKFENTKLSDMARVLKDQHIEMRKMVARMENLAKKGSDIEDLKSTFMDFHDMVMAHAAWEETVLFPCMEGTWSESDLDDLKETQEKHEKKLLGEDATMKIYGMVADLESSAGITSLKDFTRRAK
ncbi:hemerythrin domain-containing protein [Methanocella sp. MCL-LM]|uniref:hemerythrin domain-containing protein n=1 Tax=Methanocella sp. MCL-LM TaxID=3412035 RepID=UPI003C71B68C